MTMMNDNLANAFGDVQKALDHLRNEVKALQAENLMLKGRSYTLATAWAMVCDQTGCIIETVNLVPILFKNKDEAEQEIRNSGDRCDVAVPVEIRAAKVEGDCHAVSD